MKTDSTVYLTPETAQLQQALDVSAKFPAVTIRPLKYRFLGSHLSRKVLGEFFLHHPKIGKPLYVVGKCGGQGDGWFQVQVHGEYGTLTFRGCSWGYHGEGPTATFKLLVALGLPFDRASNLAYNTPGATVGAPGTKGIIYFSYPLI
jgi:hypothetical protein